MFKLNGRSARGPSHMSQSSPSGGSESGNLPMPMGDMLSVSTGPGHGDLADRARLHQLGELGVELRRSPLRAHLHDPAIPAGRLDHAAGLPAR